ncbi:hypothetical protein BNJ_00222 [Kaumoebavirus]|uniref:hypothetical protein n=1 Tax=Kaumoebavirus TaxID=1859492 RepID=UPI0009C2541C|nr:hypothetical protein BNJ_00222 [Kaumoebavirus]ARA72051.1 hypothetical protein BNJ_00222 [Kaumoebavirus]
MSGIINVCGIGENKLVFTLCRKDYHVATITFKFKTALIEYTVEDYRGDKVKDEILVAFYKTYSHIMLNIISRFLSGTLKRLKKRGWKRPKKIEW